MSERVAAPWANELRRAGFRDERVISAMDLPRDIFAPRGFGGWNSAALPIGHGQTISHPLTVAQMTSLLIEKNPRKVLEIGTGSGFQAAVLSMLCDEVCTVERIQALQSEASRPGTLTARSAGRTRLRLTPSSSRPARRSGLTRYLRSSGPTEGW